MDLLDLAALMLLLMGALFLASALFINRALSGLRERRDGTAGEGRGPRPPATAGRSPVRPTARQRPVPRVSASTATRPILA